MKQNAKRIIRNYRQVINSTPENIFPLLCPERELEWLNDWNYKMIYSESGIAEEGAVFTTSKNGEEDTVWIITKHEKDMHIVEFARVTPNSMTSTLKIKVIQKDSSSSYVDISYAFTSLSTLSNKFIEEYTEETFLKNMKFWEKSMNYFFKTGKKLKKS